jgi:hypothetical protein
VAAGALREVLASFGFEVDPSKLDEVDNKISGVVEGAKRLGEALAGGLLVHGFQRFVEDSIGAGEELTFLSRRLGLTTDDLQRWQLAARLSAVPTEALTTALDRMLRAAVGAGDSGSKAAEEFRALGVSVRDSSGRIKGTDQLLTEVGGAIGALPDPAERTAAAFRIFGRSGAQLLPLFSRGAAGLAEMKGQLDELGGGLSDEFVSAAHDAGKEQAKLDVVLDGFRSRIAVAVLPWVSRFVVALQHWGEALSKALEHTNLLKAGLVVLGGYLTVLAAQMLAAFSGPLLAILGTLLPLAALVLLVDDLVTLFEGGDSAIGDFITGLLGLDGKDQLVQDLKSAWSDLKDVVGEAAKATWDYLKNLPNQIAQIQADWTTGVDAIAAAWQAVLDFVDQVADKINAVAKVLFWTPGQALDERTGTTTVGRFAAGVRGIPQLAQQVAGGFQSAGAFVDAHATGQPLVGSISGPARSTRTLAQIRQMNRTNITVTGPNPQETARLVAQHVERIQAQERQEAMAALAPEIPGSGFEDEVSLESGGG